MFVMMLQFTVSAQELGGYDGPDNLHNQGFTLEYVEPAGCTDDASQELGRRELGQAA